MTDPRQRTGLSDVLAQYREHTGDSYAQMSTRTGLTRGYFGYLVNAQPPFYVRPETLSRIANGLGIPRAVLFRAATESAGLSVDEPSAALDRVTLLTERLRSLDDSQLVAVESLVTALMSHNSTARPLVVGE